MTITNIVVATDGSDNAQHAVSYAAEIASASGAKVTAIHVFEPLALLGHIAPPIDFAEQEQRIGGLLRDQWCAPLRDASVFADARVVEGTTAQAIIDVANEIDADLIVVGARGLSRVAEVVLGSTSTTVLHHAHRPVLVVPPVAE